ncbi:MAG: hypothetical protein RIR06_1147, partial [Bacteroidota bacterium]
ESESEQSRQQEQQQRVPACFARSSLKSIASTNRTTSGPPLEANCFSKNFLVICEREFLFYSNQEKDYE